MDRSEYIPPEMEDKAFYNKPFYKKFLVIIGGAGFNVIFALLLVMVLISMAGVGIPTTVIEDIQPGSPAESSGFRIGDEVIALNGQPVESWDDFSAMTKKFPGEEVVYTVRRGNSEIQIEVRLDNKDGEGFLGISPGYEVKKLGFIGIIKESFKFIWDISVIYAKSFVMLFSGEIPLSEARPVSPVGIVSIFQQSAAMGPQNFIFLVALISLLLGYGNLIPIVPLDGGNIILIIVESIRRKPVSTKVIEIANYIGSFILISLIIIALVLDIISPFNIMNL
jgi:regulator of sigma E protease